jgi:hypothetical protein
MTTPHSLITGRGTVAIDLCECAMKACCYFPRLLAAVYSVILIGDFILPGQYIACAYRACALPVPHTISHATHIVPILPLHVHNTITRALRISDPILLNLFFRVLHLLSDCWDTLRLLGPVYRLR